MRGERQPARIQRRRTKGWRMPDGAVVVSRPTVFGNPYAPAVIPGWATMTREMVVRDFRAWLEHPDVLWYAGPHTSFRTQAEAIKARAALMAALPTLRGKDLACWCHLSQPCHADVLLELANPDPWDGPYDYDPDQDEWVCQAHGMAACRQTEACKRWGAFEPVGTSL